MMGSKEEKGGFLERFFGHSGSKKSKRKLEVIREIRENTSAVRQLHESLEYSYSRGATPIPQRYQQSYEADECMNRACIEERAYKSRQAREENQRATMAELELQKMKDHLRRMRDVLAATQNTARSERDEYEREYEQIKQTGNGLLEEYAVRERDLRHEQVDRDFEHCNKKESLVNQLAQKETQLEELRSESEEKMSEYLEHVNKMKREIDSFETLRGKDFDKLHEQQQHLVQKEMQLEELRFESEQKISEYLEQMSEMKKEIDSLEMLRGKDLYKLSEQQQEINELEDIRGKYQKQVDYLIETKEQQGKKYRLQQHKEVKQLNELVKELEQTEHQLRAKEDQITTLATTIGNLDEMRRDENVRKQEEVGALVHVLREMSHSNRRLRTAVKRKQLPTSFHQGTKRHSNEMDDVIMDKRVRLSDVLDAGDVTCSN